MPFLPAGGCGLERPPLTILSPSFASWPLWQVRQASVVLHHAGARMGLAAQPLERGLAGIEERERPRRHLGPVDRCGIGGPGRAGKRARGEKRRSVFIAPPCELAEIVPSCSCKRGSVLDPDQMTCARRQDTSRTAKRRSRMSTVPGPAAPPSPAAWRCCTTRCTTRAPGSPKTSATRSACAACCRRTCCRRTSRPSARCGTSARSRATWRSTSS